MGSLKMILIVGLGLAPAENGTDKSVPYKLGIERNEQAFYNHSIDNGIFFCFYTLKDRKEFI